MYEDFSAVKRWPQSTANSSTPGSMFTQRQPFAKGRDRRHGFVAPRLNHGANRRTPYEVARFTDHGPLAHGPPPAVSCSTDYGSLAPGPPDEVSHFADDDPLEHGSPPGSPTEVSNLALTEITNFTDSSLPWKKRFAILRLYTIYKTELSSSGGMNEESVWLKMANRYGNSELGDPRHCRNLILDMKREYERLKNKDIKPFELRFQWDAVFLDEAENTFENIENPAVFKVKSDLQKINLTRPDRITLLKVFGKYKSKLLLNNFDDKEQIVWEKIAKEVSKKCSTFYGKRRCCHLIHQFKKSYEKFKETNQESRKGQFFHYARRTFESMYRWPTRAASPSIPHLSTFAQEQTSLGSSHMDSSEPLSNQFSPHIDQTYDLSPPRSPPGVSHVTDHGPLPSEHQGVSHVTDHGPSPPELSHGVSQFTDYDHLPPAHGFSHITDHGPLQPAPAREVSQFTGNSETSFDELSSSVSLPWKKKFELLRLYTIYKDELSSSEGMNEESVWQKISNKIEVCDAKQCRNQIRNLKCEYERMRNTKPYECKLEEAVFLDEAENAFENNYNPVVFDVNSRHLEKWIMWKPDRLKLLQVYIKYKKELLLHSFDVEKQNIWEKFAVEVSKKSKNFYGKRRCCHLLNLYKKQLADHERKNKNGQKHYFFDQARKTFEST